MSNEPRAQDEDFDPEPARTLAADEPRTPMWMPALGAVLFVGVGFGLVAADDDDAASGAAPAPAASGSARTPAPGADGRPDARPTGPAGHPHPGPAGVLPAAPGAVDPAGRAAGTPSAGSTPEDIRRIRQQIFERRQKQGGGNPAEPAPGSP